MISTLRLAVGQRFVASKSMFSDFELFCGSWFCQEANVEFSQLSETSYKRFRLALPRENCEMCKRGRQHCWCAAVLVVSLRWLLGSLAISVVQLVEIKSAHFSTSTATRRCIVYNSKICCKLVMLRSLSHLLVLLSVVQVDSSSIKTIAANVTLQSEY